MSEANKNPAGPESLEEELVAYLDGELNVARRRDIERLLAEDPSIRQRLQSMEQAWETLDVLSASSVDESFTQSTVEMVAMAAETDAQELAQNNVRRRSTAWMTRLSGIAAAVAIGFLGVRIFGDDPNDQLLRDLPVIENVDHYRHVESIEFLRRLHSEAIFSQETSDAP
jgi:anti-sigma factor RsiW